jgi:hypothetical protein
MVIALFGHLREGLRTTPCNAFRHGSSVHPRDSRWTDRYCLLEQQYLQRGHVDPSAAYF